MMKETVSTQLTRKTQTQRGKKGREVRNGRGRKRKSRGRIENESWKGTKGIKIDRCDKNGGRKGSEKF